MGHVGTRHGMNEKARHHLRRAGYKVGGRAHSDEASDKKMIEKAIHEHDDQMHEGRHTKLKLKTGGAVKGAPAPVRLDKKARGGKTGSSDKFAGKPEVETENNEEAFKAGREAAAHTDGKFAQSSAVEGKMPPRRLDKTGYKRGGHVGHKKPHVTVNVMNQPHPMGPGGLAVPPVGPLAPVPPGMPPAGLAAGPRPPMPPPPGPGLPGAPRPPGMKAGGAVHHKKEREKRRDDLNGRKSGEVRKDLGGRHVGEGRKDLGGHPAPDMTGGSKSGEGRAQKAKMY